MTIPEADDIRPIRRVPGGISRRNAVACRVSLLAPGGRRTCWWYLARCPSCRRSHLGRARELADVTVTRRLACGHWVIIVIARTYGAAA